MDLLLSLDLDEVPEQQTRTAKLSEDLPDFQQLLGFDACCTCGKALSPPKTNVVECPTCQRVSYCSSECLKKDSAPSEDPQEQALGHSSLICSLLSLCNDDDDVESGNDSSLTKEQKASSLSRVISELESYPATLANVLLEGPPYQKMLKRRRGSGLTVHVVGASEAELWQEHPEKAQRQKVVEAYADALSEVAEKFNLRSINLVFAGPECPRMNLMKTTLPTTVDGSNSSGATLQVKCCQGVYSKQAVNKWDIGEPDVIVFFNPGFTCPDYDWKQTLSQIPDGTPFLMTTNTELEGIADAQFLYDESFIANLPIGLADIVGSSSTPVDDPAGTFFSLNPFCGSRIRQSGSMANDLFAKSRWILGGVWGTAGVVIENEVKTDRKRKLNGGGNSKKKNPALV